MLSEAFNVRVIWKQWSNYEGARGAWPPERPGDPLETPGVRGYKGPLNGPLEITRQIQYVLQHINIILSTDGDAPSPAD